MNPRIRLLGVLSCLLLQTLLGRVPNCHAAESAPSAGRNIYVDALQGDDRADGLAARRHGSSGPIRSLRAAVKMTRPGGTIHLTPQREPYRDIAVFHNVHGEPGKPITLDGHGATITGADPLNPDDWQEVSSGL